MKKNIISSLFLTALTATGTSAVYAGAVAPFVSSSLVCTTATGPGAQSILVSGETCSFPGPKCFDNVEYTRGQISSAKIPCELAQAVTNFFIFEFCGVTDVEGNIIGNLGDIKSETTTLVLPNGNLQHQWNVLCGFGPA